MSRRIIKHARALLDLEQQSEYIRHHNPRAALRFLDAAEEAFRMLAAMPGIGAPYGPDIPALAGLRSFPISKFKNHIIFYLSAEDSIRVLRVLHGARDVGGLLAEEFGAGAGDEDDRPPEEPDGS